jgi:hypothetical protein
MEKFNRGDSPYIKVVHKVYTFSTDTWANADPDATYPKITITDSAGTKQVDAVSMTKRATGKFDYTYTLVAGAALGTWTGYIQVLNGTYPDISYFEFEVVA